MVRPGGGVALCFAMELAAGDVVVDRPRDVARAALPGGSCFGPVLEGQHATERFIVEYDPGIGAEVAADVGAWAEVALDVQRAMGWPLPAGSDRYLVPIYLVDEDLGGGATRDQRCGEERLPVIVVGRDALIDPVVAADTLAHEVNHVLQLAYGGGPEVWFAEATATWMEEHVHDSDGWAVWVPAFSRATHISLFDDRREIPEVFAHMYGRCVWPFFLDEHVGGPDLVRRMWEEGGRLGDGAGVVGQQALLAAVGEDLDALYPRWLDVVAAMQFRDHPRFEPVTPAAVLRGPGVAASSDAPPLASWGQAFLRVDDVGATGLRVVIEVRAGADWARRAALVRDGAVVRSVAAPDGDGVVELELLPEPGATWWLALSPRSDAPGVWTWSLDASELPETPPTVVPPADCGCAASTAATAWWAAGAALLTRRRRPSTVGRLGASKQE